MSDDIENTIRRVLEWCDNEDANTSNMREVAEFALQAAMNAKMPDDRFVDIARDLESEILDLRNQLAKNEALVKMMAEALELGDTLVELYQLDCGDNSCYFKARGKGGMRTNGGCRCGRNQQRWVENLAKNMLWKSREALDAYRNQKGE